MPHAELIAERIARYRVNLLHFLRNRGAGDDEAGDVLGELFLRLYRSDRLNVALLGWGYLSLTALRIFLDARRRLDAHPLPVPLDAFDPVTGELLIDLVADPRPGTERQVLARAQLAEVMRLADPADVRIVVAADDRQARVRARRRIVAAMG